MPDRELPDSWQWARFGDVATIESNLVDPSEYQDSPHIAPNHIESGTGVLLPYTTVKADKVISPKHLFRPGQVLYSKIRPYLAKAVLIDFSGLCSADMYPVSTDLETSYLHRWLVSPEFTGLVSENQGRTLLPKVNQDALVELPVPVPPLAEQRRIIAKIEALTARSRRAREALNAIPALLERFRQSVLAAAFRGDLTADWREKNPDVEPAEELLKRIRIERRRRWEEAELARMRAKGKVPGDDRWKEKYEEPAPVDASELTELPEGWCWATIGNVSHVAGGLTKHNAKRAEGSEAPLVSVAAVGLRRINREGIGKIRLLPEDGNKGELKQGDLLIVEGNGSLSHIGRVAMWNVDIPGARHQNHLIRVRPALLAPEYVLEWLASPMGRDLIVHAATSAAGLYTLSISKIEQIPIPIPSLREQDVMVGVMRHANERLRRMVPSLDDASQQLVALERAILAKAFRGELVPQDPNDEPASVLLERLRAETAQNGKPATAAGRRRAAASPPPAQPDTTGPGKKPRATRRSQAPARSRG